MSHREAGSRAVSPGYDRSVGDELELTTTAPMVAGALTFLVGCPDAQVIACVRDVFQDLPTVDRSSGGLEAELFVLLPDGEQSGPRWSLSGPQVGSLSGMTLAEALAMLVTGVNLAALAAEPERLHLHAGAAVRRGQAVLMAAARDTGKTTTLARLVLRGWDFISDEAVSIGRDDDEVRGFPKPLSIKPGGRARVVELEQHMVPALDEVADHEVVHVPLGALGAKAVLTAEPRLVVLLRRGADERPSGMAASLPVHPADAVVHLMGETMDSARFGDRAVFELARLAVRCGCQEVIVGDPEATADHIEQLFEAPPPARLPVREMRGGPYVKENIVSVLVGDRVVIHQQPDGAILALDPPGTQVWLVLGGWEADDQVDLRGPVVAPFVDQLVALGLVEPRWPGA